MKVPGGEEFDELSDGESREGGDERVIRENGEIMMSRRRRRRGILHGARWWMNGSCQGSINSRDSF
ncbi:hypothetical protein F2Q69_00015675 [Brassica cretica]|uniref:Uncharacterized protein n=1 Tax=Brassica cretica TaxID=69181 RepID=A0A8S9QVG1_BRACR|nr:hypothetical protein F2Q69_00015675 [Brassica cretica]